MTVVMKKKFIAAVIFSAGLIAYGAAKQSHAPVTASHGTFNEETKVIAATFASAWCAPCKVLEPKLAKVIPSFREKPVHFLRFNFTFGEQDASRDEAAAVGVTDVYERFKGATGFTLLIDAKSGAVIDRLTMDHSAPAMRAAISQAIAAAGGPSLQSPVSQHEAVQ